MKRRVLVIGGGNHHNALGVIRSLGERGYDVELITIGDLKKHYISSSRYVASHRALKDIKELSAYLLYRSQAVETEKEIIISCSDSVTEHLNLYLERLRGHYYVPGTDVEGNICSMMDKHTMMKIALKHGLEVPETWCLPSDLHKVKFPCITKSQISSHGHKDEIKVCDNYDDLSRALLECTGEVFAQSYIDKKEEVQFIGCSLNAGKEVIIPGMSRVLRSQPNTNTGFLEYGPVDPFYSEIVNKAKDIIRDFRYSGLFSFEILRGHDDKVWFMEVNFRNDGNAWCVTKSGINLPVIWVKACLGEDYNEEIKEPKRILMMPEFQDFKQVMQHKISFWEWISDVRKTDFFMEYDKKDIKPFFRYIMDKLV